MSSKCTFWQQRVTVSLSYSMRLYIRTYKPLNHPKSNRRSRNCLCVRLLAGQVFTWKQDFRNNFHKFIKSVRVDPTKCRRIKVCTIQHTQFSYTKYEEMFHMFRHISAWLFDISWLLRKRRCHIVFVCL